MSSIHEDVCGENKNERAAEFLRQQQGNKKVSWDKRGKGKGNQKEEERTMRCRAVWRAHSLPLTGQQLDFSLRRISPLHRCLEHELGTGRGSRKNSRNCTGNRHLGMCKTGFAGTAMQGEERSHILKGRKGHWSQFRRSVWAAFFRINSHNLGKKRKIAVKENGNNSCYFF